VPSAGHNSTLWNVWCTRTTSDCWAVGDTHNAVGAELNEALHWTGGKWSVVRTPDPGGSTASGDFNALYGIACTSASNCWAVGLYYKAGHDGRNQVLHWNGMTWTPVPAPELGTGNGSFDSLFAVRCPSATNCWAVGTANKSLGSAGLNEALHWDGRKWSLVPTPDPGGTSRGALSELNGVACGGPSDCWAVGDYAQKVNTLAPGLSQALHWNGRTWSWVHTPSPGGSLGGDVSALFGAFCLSPRDCWAAGWYGKLGMPDTFVNLVSHWDGRTWHQVTTPNPDGTGLGAQNVLLDVTCTSPANCWAVGEFGSTRSGGVVLNEILRWNGHTWSAFPSPDPAGTASRDSNMLERVRCATQTNCWAVGSAQTAGMQSVNAALHWNGHRWLAG
jgi:hypothetical protein